MLRSSSLLTAALRGVHGRGRQSHRPDRPPGPEEAIRGADTTGSQCRCSPGIPPLNAAIQPDLSGNRRTGRDNSSPGHKPEGEAFTQGWGLVCPFLLMLTGEGEGELIALRCVAAVVGVLDTEQTWRTVDLMHGA